MKGYLHLIGQSFKALQATLSGIWTPVMPLPTTFLVISKRLIIDKCLYNIF